MKEDLMGLLKDQLRIEEDSIVLYGDFIKRIDDASISSKIEAIRKSEINHADIVRDMIRLVENQGVKVEKYVSEGPNLDISGFMNEYGNMHIHTRTANYSSVISKLLKEIGSPVLYISYNKVLKYTKNFLEKESIDLSRVKFVSCIANNEGNYIDPSALTDISIEIGEFIDQNKNSTVIIDSISGFSVYNDEEKILKFISTVNSRCQSADAGPIWISIDIEINDEFKNKISGICNRFFDV